MEGHLKQESQTKHPFVPDMEYVYDTDTSVWSSSSSSYQDPFEESPSDGLPPLAFPRVSPVGSRRGREVQQSNKPQRKPLQLPGTGPVQFIKTQSETTINMKDLKSQVDHLQKELSEARTENHLLKELLHLHTVALKFYQAPQNGINEITVKHKEATALAELLNDSYVVRDGLAEQLQASEKKPEATRNKLQQLLRDPPSLLEEEEVSVRLIKATEELQEKERRIQDLEKKLDDCRSTIKWQLLIQKLKSDRARNESWRHK